jgi:hypothetical protein
MEQISSSNRAMETETISKHERSSKSQMSRGDFFKRTLLLAVGFLTLLCACFAQDIIVTKDARKINAKVTEVNVDNIRYKQFDFQDGPVYTIQKSDIASIVYQNGQVETFVTESSHPAATAQPYRQTVLAQNSVPIVSSGNILTDMQIYSPSLFSRYDRGKNISGTGVMFTCLGAIVSIAGIGATNSSGNPEWLNLVYPGIIFINVGIPFLAVGGGMKRSAIRNFRIQYHSSQSAAPYFQFNAYPNRIGLAYVF